MKCKIRRGRQIFLGGVLSLIFLTGLLLHWVLETDLNYFVPAPPAARLAKIMDPSPVRVLSFATDPKHPLLQLLLSSSPYPIEVLGRHETWRGLRQKFESVHAYLVAHHLEQAQDLVMFVDGYDTLFTPGAQDIVAKFKAFHKPLVVSAEAHCSHHPICTSNSKAYPQSPPHTPFKYVNSGTYIGHAWAVYAMLDAVLKKYPTHNDDQFLLHAYFLEHPEKVALDYQQSLFSLMAGTQLQDYAYHTPTGQIHNTITQSEPIVLHGNGGPGLLLKLYRDYIGPREGRIRHWLYETDVRLRLSLLAALQWSSLKLYKNWMHYQLPYCDRLAGIVYKSSHLVATLRPMV